MDKEVVVRLSVPKIAGAPQISDLAKRTRDAGSATTDLGKSFDKLGPDMRRATLDAGTMWRSITDGAKKATAATKEYNQEVEKKSLLSRKETKALTKLTGTAGLAGLGRTAFMGGGLGLGAMAFHDLGGLAMNAFHNQKFGQGPLQTADTGMLIGGVAGVVDTLKGRKYQEGATDKIIEKAIQQVSRAFNTAGRTERDRAEEGRLGRAFHYEPGLEGYNARTYELLREMHPITKQADIQATEFSRKKTLLDSGTLNMPSQQAMLSAMAGISKNELEGRKRLKDVITEQIDIEKQKAGALRASVQAKRSQFATLDPVQRMMAKELGGKLQRGEELSPEEMENAGGLGVLRDQVQKHREQQAEPGFVDFLKEAGDREERNAAGRAQQLGVGVNAVLQMDEEKIIATMTKVVEQANMKIRAIETRLEDVQNRQDKFNDAWQKEKGALHKVF